MTKKKTLLLSDRVPRLLLCWKINYYVFVSQFLFLMTLADPLYAFSFLSTDCIFEDLFLCLFLFLYFID